MEQKELKTLYTEELRKVWGNDEGMVKFCAKETEYVIEHDGYLYNIEKPRIKTDFCFGYGYSGISTSEDEENAYSCAAVAQKSEEYFIEQNLADIDDRIKAYKCAKEFMNREWSEGEHPRHLIKIRKHYSRQPLDCKLRVLDLVDTYYFSDNNEVASLELIDKLIAGYEEVKKSFTKRLQTYLKRYGLSKVRSWTYLVD